MLVSAKNLEIDEDKYFGFVSKKQLDMEKNRIEWAKKIIDEYKKERLIW